MAVLIIQTCELKLNIFVIRIDCHWFLRASEGTITKILKLGYFLITEFKQLMAVLVFPNNYVIVRAFYLLLLTITSKFSVHFHPLISVGGQTLLEIFYSFTSLSIIKVSISTRYDDLVLLELNLSRYCH